ncbi:MULTISPECIES: chromate transporter [unclassified Metabacillus]|uniref:chromate transporter n=1 Tax=Metabacillus sp. JX24 TaxID=3240759 RepID=UPI0030FD60B8
MIYIHIFLAFFLPGILGYGGGPASIPLIEKEVVDRYEWQSVNEFSETLAIGNALPGPIATKMAGLIGYQQGGWLGAAVGLFATIAPSLILMLVLLNILMKYKESPQVKRLSAVVRPVIAVMLGVMTYQFLDNSAKGSGIWHTLFLFIISLLLLEKWKVHPAYVIAGALVYGGVFLS